MSSPQILKHMAPKDKPVWASYYYTPEGQTYDAWEFDVCVGDPEDPGVFYPPSQRRQALYLNSLKVDAVAWLFNTPTLIECKPHAGLSALGQVAGYRQWYRIIFGVKPRGLIVCSSMSRQVQTLCLLDEIDVRIVRPADDFTLWTATNHVQFKVQERSVLPQLAAVS